MQTVSELWKDAHKQTLLNESYVEISINIADPDALADASSTDNGAVYISNTPGTVDQVDDAAIPYATLEQNLWVLDGSRKSIPENEYVDGGYVGEVFSNDEGNFDTKIPVITIDFSKVHTKPIPGITIVWGTAYNEYAENFIVTAYNGDNVVATKEIVGNTSITSIVELDIINYDRIIIQILSWCLPNRRARIDEISIGIRKSYTKKELMNYSHKQSVNPISTSLPKMEIRFSLDNSDNSYNPFNLNGLAKYLSERQEVVARYGLKLSDNSIEWIDGGVFYLSEWYAKQNGITADFVARDLLEFMSGEYKDDMSEISERSLYDLAIQLLKKAALPLNKDGTVKWVVDESLKSIYTTAKMPDDTIKNCLQMIANAGCCTLDIDRTGTLHIEPVDNKGTDYEINSFNTYSKPETTLSKSLQQVIVKVYQYTIGEKGVESTTTDVASIVSDVGESVIVDNPLITNSERATIVGKWIGDYLKNRMTLRSTGRADVRLDALDIVNTEHTYGTHKVRMTDVEFKFNGAFRGMGEGRVIGNG